jgi:hypothetical protein
MEPAREAAKERILEFEKNKVEILARRQAYCRHKYTILGRVNSNTGIQSRTCELCLLKQTLPLWKWYQLTHK